MESGTFNEFSGNISQKVSLDKQESGLYLVKIISDKNVYTKRVVVQ